MPKDRDRHLIEERNRSLCRRYCYWTEVKRLRFDDALKILSQQEFFLSKERILTVIRDVRKSDNAVPAVTKVRLPRLTCRQLSLFTDGAGCPVSQIRRETGI